MTYQQLQDKEFVGFVALAPLLERKAHGENVDDDLAALNAELDGIGAELREHPENPLRAIREAIEGERLGR